jgi:hypothetical protein
MADMGILTERSTSYTPTPNGAIERCGGVVVTKARYLEIGTRLPSFLWPEIVRIAACSWVKRTAI